VMVIMLQNRHPDLVSAAATGGTHLGHLHTHQGELSACRHFHIGAAALAEQQQVIPSDIVPTGPAVKLATRLVDQELSAFEWSAGGCQLEGEGQGVSQDAGELPDLQSYRSYGPITDPALDGLHNALRDRQLVHLGLRNHHKSVHDVSQLAHPEIPRAR
jgi:hypothetical protein